jgi:hypothetical protein
MNPSPPTEDPDDDATPAPPARSADAWADAARARADRLHQRRPAAPEPAQRRAWFQLLPTKLAASVVFLVALTTLLGNLLELREKSRDASVPSTPAPAPAAAENTKLATAAGPVRTRIALDRIAVQEDGSPGTTDWRFTVEADGQPLLAFEHTDLDDSGGRNVVRPQDATAVLRLAQGRPVRLDVKGWRLSRFRLQGEPDAVGEGRVIAGGGEATIRVAAHEASGGAFVFYFSADAQ